MKWRFQIVCALGAGLALSVLEMLTILSTRGVPRPSAGELLTLGAWLAIPYALVFWAAGLGAALVLSGVARLIPARAAFAGAVTALPVLIWLRGMISLREGGSTYGMLELLLAGCATAAGAAVALAVPPAPARGGRGLSRGARVGIGVAGVLAVAWAATAGYEFAGIFRAPIGGGGGGAGGGAHGAVPPAGDASARPNVILISIDTLRADHVSAYGYPRRTTPNIDALAKDGVRYAQASTTAAFTVPSHASMMTGLFPSTHGATYQYDDPKSFVIRGMSTSYPTLAELLSEQGYDTAGFVSCSLVGRQFGFARGFSVYDDRFDRLQSVPEILFSRSTLYRGLEKAGLFSPRDLDAERRAEELTPLAEAWVRARPAGAAPFFLFVHYYDPHAAYDPPEPFNRRDDGTTLAPVYEGHLLLQGGYTLTPEALNDTLTLYDGEIRYVDRHVGNLLRTLKYTGSLDNAIVILTSDHGESFGEHDHWAHSRVLYEDVTRVPFIMRLPGRAAAGTVVQDVIAQPTDILPTVLAAAGLPAPDGVEGRDLIRLMKPQAGHAGGGGGGVAFAEQTRDLDSARRFGKRYDRDLVTARTVRWKYIEATTSAAPAPPSADREELYDLLADPGETSNLAAAQPDALISMRQLLHAWRSARQARRGGKQEPIDEGTIEKLRSLGYVQ